MGSIPTQVLRFFSKEKVSGLVYKCYSSVPTLNVPKVILYDTILAVFVVRM